ncbi:hypothetical protein AB0D46_10325 [Streptomyces sp. NPDC048383]|uniref:hypothetical protein n=1 Tax=Streptomyces sp. NPDC048383 TaxID=3155386 RepID=UPI0034438972
MGRSEAPELGRDGDLRAIRARGGRGTGSGRGFPGRQDAAAPPGAGRPGGSLNGSSLIPLVIALIGVGGTLFAPLLTQRLVARVQAEQGGRQERVAEAQWRREQQVAALDKRRDCYVAANSGYRRFRVELMNYLWLVDEDALAPERRTALEDARHAMHASFAEARMAASGAVLAELDAVSQAFASLYDRGLRLEEGSPAPDGSFEEIQSGLLRANEQGVVRRGAMRAHVGAEPGPAVEPY